VSLPSYLGRRLLATPAYLWAGLLLLGLFVGLLWISRTAPMAGALAIQQAEVQRGQGAGFSQVMVQLPHVWDNEVPRWSGEATYHLAWPEALQSRQDESVPLALLIPRVGARFRVMLNGHQILDQGWNQSGYVDASVMPQWVQLQPDFLASDPRDNRIDIEVRGQVLRRSGLSPVQVGDAYTLRKRYDQLMWWQVHTNWMVASCAFMLGLMGLLMWLQTRERMFGFLAAASLAWTVRLALTPLVAPPMPFELWYYLHKLSFTAYCGYLCLFVWDLFDYHQGALRTFVTRLLWLGPIWLAITVALENYELYRIWMTVIALTSIVALIKMGLRARWGLDANQRLMLVVGVATMASGVRDYAVVHLGLPGDADVRWMTLGSLMLMFAMGWVLLRRTAQSMEEVGRLNADLSRKVGEREAELHSVFDRLRAAENQRVLEAERRRLTRDMHDGLGSQLVQTLNLVHSSGERVLSAAVAPMLSHALEDLRMTLDSLEPMEGDLTTILGTLRQRISPTLLAADIDLVWDVEEVSTLPGLEARDVLHLFRCLQEVFANVVKHARANQVIVRTRETSGRVELSVCDNGIGLGLMPDAAFRDGGRGIGNIRLRAGEIGAEVQFTDGLPGTCVSFIFAVQAKNIVDSQAK
jgi:signal transduction histidine kinase